MVSSCSPVIPMSEPELKRVYARINTTDRNRDTSDDERENDRQVVFHRGIVGVEYYLILLYSVCMNIPFT